MKFKSLLILFFVLILGILVVSSVSATETSNMVQYDDYLFGIDFYEINYEAGFNHYNNTNVTQESGACSSFFKDNIAGRSFDWVYDNKATVVIKVYDAKYKSIGVAGDYLVQSECLDIIKGVGDYSHKIELLPFFTLDGVNEAGVYCNSNVVPGKDKSSVNSTAAIETRVTIAAPMLGRFILDNFDSAKDAVEYIRDYCDVFNSPKVSLHLIKRSSFKSIFFSNSGSLFSFSFISFILLLIFFTSSCE